ncbi:FecR family protein [Arcticibacter sp.]|jgi:ferric-dicitrate binding protein FerR (iron transport regulator)|uniref:FecR family protein n=1 Tax=Arcticibacter sp. TaxID=1872630 RepID=UPI003890D6ED
MDQHQFYKKLLDRYKSNQASLEEIEVLFHLIKTGEIEQSVFESIESGPFLHEEIAGILKTVPDVQPLVPSVVSLRRSRSGLWKAAAAIVIIISVSLTIYSRKREIRDIVDPVRLVRVEVPLGRVRKLELSDGTQVWLNAGSILEYPEKFNREKRVLTLEGEAFFQVSHDAKKPFIIHSGELNTVVLGTSFNVKTYDDSPAQVSVRSGKVSVAERAADELKGGDSEVQRMVVLTKDQQATYLGKEGFNIRKGVPAGEYMGWQEGELVFTGKTLLEMKPVLERWYGVKILMDSKKLASCRMVGSYRQETLKNVLEAMRFALNITYKIEGNKVTIRGGSCK